MRDNSPWITHSSSYTYQNPWFKVKTSQVTTPGGKPGIYGVIEMRPAAAIVAMNEHDELCLIREYRYPHQRWLWQVPVGAVNERETDHLLTAQRELSEETGFTSVDWQYIGTTHGVKGLTNHLLHTYLAKNIKPGIAQVEHDEGIDGMRFITIKDFFEEVRQGGITDEETIVPVTLVAARLHLL